MVDDKGRNGRVVWVKSLFNSLGLSLFLWLFGVIIVAFALYSFVSIRTTSEQWSESVQECAERFSDLIKRSTHYGMLLNRKEDVHRIIQTIAQEPGVEGVRIYDKRGAIIFSAADDEIGDHVDLQAEACVGCHDGSVPLQSVPSDSRARIIGDHTTGRVLGLISPIENVPECSNAPCHAHPPDVTVLGVLDVKMSLTGADARMSTARRQVIAAAILTAILVGMVSAVFIMQGVRRPVRALIESTERIAGGDLRATITTGRRDELGQLAKAFNKMTDDLRVAREELTQWSSRLERSLRKRTEELNRTQRQVVQMEKMASLGKLSATVAHELNNPLAGILNYAKLVQRTLAEGEMGTERREELDRYMGLVHREAARCGDIVRNLLLFARRSGAELARMPLNPIIDRALMIVRHHLEMADIQLQTELLADNDEIVCDGNQLEQALVALFVNAVEAMPAGGTLTVRAEAWPQSVKLTVADSGVGISPAELPHVFEPFFSTKDAASAVGLGLAVVYGIVQRHGGQIDVESEVDTGTTFTIVLPRRPEETSRAPAEDATAAALEEVGDGNRQK